MSLNIKPFSTVTLIFIASVLFSCNYLSPASNNKEPTTSPIKDGHVKDEIIVKFKESVTQEKIKEITASLGCEIIREIGPTKTFLIKIKTGEAVKKMVSEFKQFEDVEYAQPNYIFHTMPEKK